MLCIDRKSAKEVLQKDVQNIVSKTDFCQMTTYIKYFFLF